MIEFIKPFYLKLIGYESYGIKGYSTFEFGSDPAASHFLDIFFHFLGFDGDYESLGKIIGPEMDKIPLSKPKLHEAVSNLATCQKSINENDKCKFATSLFILKLMIVEPIAHPEIAEEIYSNYDKGDWVLSSRILLCISTGKQQKRKRNIDDNSFNSVQACPTSTPACVHTSPPKEQSLDSYNSVQPSPPHSPYWFHPSPSREPSLTDYYIGYKMVELLAVRFEFQGTIHGTIMLDDGYYNYITVPRREHYCIYNRAVDDPEVVKGGEIALLSGNRCIQANDLKMYVDLRDEEGREVINTVCNWCFFDDHVWDEVVEDNLKGINGQDGAILYYAAISNAMEASVEVELIEGGDPDNVCGYITSVIDKFQSERYETFLFRKPNVTRGQRQGQGQRLKQKANVIPLSRSNVAVPMDSSLMIRANLNDGDTKKVIADFSANFSPHDWYERKKGCSDTYDDTCVRKFRALVVTSE